MVQDLAYVHIRIIGSENMALENGSLCVSMTTSERKTFRVFGVDWSAGTKEDLVDWIGGDDGVGWGIYEVNDAIGMTGYGEGDEKGVV